MEDKVKYTVETLTDEEARFIDAYRTLSEEEKEQVLECAKKLLEEETAD